MDCSFESCKKLFAARNQHETHYTRLHLAIVEHYVTYLQKMSEEELPEIFMSDSAHRTKISERYAQELKKYVFMVPRLKKLPESQYGINKYRPVKEFIGFLIRLMYHKPAGSITDSCGYQIKNLEMELRFLLTVLGDTPLMVCADEHEELKNLWAEFVDVANKAGSLVHSVFFRAFGEMDDGISAILNHIYMLKANIIKLSTVVPAYMYCNTSVVDSLLVLDLIVRHLDDLMNRDDNSVSDVKDLLKYGA